MVNFRFTGLDLKTIVRKMFNSLMFLDHFHIISSMANPPPKKKKLSEPNPLHPRVRNVNKLPRTVRNLPET